MSELWFYGQNGTQRGPVEADALRALVASGQLQPTDLVWREGMSDWVPAHTVPEIFPAAGVAHPADVPPPPPPPPPVGPPNGPPIAQPVEHHLPVHVGPNQSGRATTSLVLGICSVVGCFCPFIGLILGVIAIIMGLGVQQGPHKAIAIAGIVCGAIGVLLGLPHFGGFAFRF